MKKYAFKIIAICLAIFVFTPLMQVYGAEYYWYCKRNSEHRQPESDSNFTFLEEYGGVYVDKKYGDNSEEKVIYLTFDVGYENGNVAKILDVMKEEGVRGSFFILENVINRNPDLVLRMASENHLVCNHTMNHKNLVGKSEEVVKKEILGLEKKYEELTGKKMAKFFRPPEGTFDENLLKTVQSLGYKTVFWSFAYADCDNKAQMSEEAAMKKIMDNLHNGEIMLLHPTSETNAKIMKRLIVELKNQGYRFATLDEL